jgi:hypothetical protein
MSNHASTIQPRCLPTTLGSLPHTDVGAGTALMFSNTPAIPAWVQFPKRSPLENMMVQYTEGLPGLRQEGDRFYFDTSAGDYVDQLTDFYTRYLAACEEGDLDALESFALSTEYAAGFHAFLEGLPSHIVEQDVFMLKGQVTGPFTLGTNLLDENRRCSYYNEQLHDAVVKTIALKARWQMLRMKPFGRPITIFLDEPSLLGFGSQTFITVSREEVIRDINEVVASIHALDGKAGVHCEENTDWSMLMESDLDILDFDAYDHMQAIALYPAELRQFLNRGGWLGWGIVPTLSREAAGSETVESLLSRFEDGLERLERSGFDRDVLLRQAIITPSCGAGGVLDVPLAERVLELLRELSLLIRNRYGLDRETTAA